ncbi:MAG: hypothetical protein ACKPHU_35080, partial [Planctomycetaceae bacterium]
EHFTGDTALLDAIGHYQGHSTRLPFLAFPGWGPGHNFFCGTLPGTLRYWTLSGIIRDTALDYRLWRFPVGGRGTMFSAGELPAPFNLSRRITVTLNARCTQETCH